MDVTDERNNEQAARWNGPAGCAWVDAQELIDEIFRPVEELLVDAAVRSGGRVLDVGCGTGGTTVAIARALGAKDHCIGIDLSEPMVAAARARAAREGTPARFIHGDAQTHAFEPGSFDTIVSRFGVMFFDDFVRAFANLRRAASDDSELRVVVWRSAAENPFMTTAERAAEVLVPNLPPRESDAPGQFALADRQRVFRILEDSGWAEIDVQPMDVSCAFPEPELVGYFTRFGPLGRIFYELDEATRVRVVEKVRPAFDPYVHADEVRFTAACWTIGARGTTRTP